ncbi:hypothetical protein Efla_001802 [Eimeria flavescens]
MLPPSSLCPLDGRYKEVTEDLRCVWSDFHLMRHRVYVELKWLEFFVDRIHPKGPLSNEQRRALEPLYEVTEEDSCRITFLEKKTNHDVKAVEYFLKERLQGVAALANLAEFTHLFCTSEDVNNLAYGLMTQRAVHAVLLPALLHLVDELLQLVREHADTPLLARTHGQPATPTTFGKEFAVYRHRLNKHIQKLKTLKPVGKFNGAVGNFNAHLVAFPDADWPALAQQFVESLGLEYQPLSTQIECHDWLSELCDDIARCNTTLSGLCVDCWTYISRQETPNPKPDLLVLRKVEGEVGSSTMPHKINPIDFENAEGNLGLASAMLRFFSNKLPVSRLQRDLSDSTCMRSLGCAFGYSLVGVKACTRGLKRITVDAAAACKELSVHWEVLAEPIQCVLRREGEPGAYELLKELTRGKQVSPSLLRELCTKCRQIPEADRQRLAALTPETYVGLAGQLAKLSS